jgi:energy-coupling factor transporter ATP-binding protein EcfA2
MSLTISRQVLGAVAKSDGDPDNLVIRPGTQVLVLGESATGKTSLAMRLAGLVATAEAQTPVLFGSDDLYLMDARKRALLVGFVPTRPAALFSGLTTTVERELRLSLALLDLDEGAFEAEKHRVIADFCLDSLLERSPFELSGGEQVRFALALTLIKRPQLLILDQVFDALSSTARADTQKILRAYQQAGGIIVETHSSAPPWCEDADCCICLARDDGPLIGHYRDLRETLHSANPFLLDDDTWNASAHAAEPFLYQENSHEPQLRVEGLSYAYPSNGFSIGPVDIGVNAGESVALLGPNGAGKTTLLMNLGLLRHPAQGDISVRDWAGETVSAPATVDKAHTWARYVLYSFQEPDDQLYCKTVLDEIHETSKRIGRIDKPWIDRVAQTLGLMDVMHKSPMVSPRPVRRLVSIASVLAAKPPIVLLDEPTAELDRRQKERLLQILAEYCSQGGICMFISHDQWFVEAMASRKLTMRGGILVSDER